MTSTEEDDRYELFYWPSIPGRGELVRLVFEDAGVPYVDVARLPEDQGGGVKRVLEMRAGEGGGLLPFAPPILRVGELIIAQTALICDFLGRRFALAPEDEVGRIGALQVQLTIADVLQEAHDVHHPISTSLYYEDQKDAAKEAATHFHTRMPEWLAYFERLVDASPEGWLVGSSATHADLSAFQMLEGLAYAFPNAFAAAAPKVPGLMHLRERVRVRPGIADYLASDRRLPFNQDGIFRHYPELDA